jgi:hypothetical protein
MNPLILSTLGKPLFRIVVLHSGLYLCSVNFVKMISHIHKSFVWLWMAALLSASVGVSVQQVYCYCLGKTTVSLFVANDACQAHGGKTVQASASAGCCAKKEAPSKPSCCEKPNPSDKGCTKKTTKVFQLKTAFEVGSSDFKKLDTPKLGPILPVFFAFAHASFRAKQVGFQHFDHPPPPVSGRALCVRHGVFRC